MNTAIIYISSFFVVLDLRSSLPPSIAPHSMKWRQHFKSNNGVQQEKVGNHDYSDNHRLTFVLQSLVKVELYNNHEHNQQTFDHKANDTCMGG